MSEVLNGGQVAFYTTVTTAIPVFVLGYVFVASTFVRRASDWMEAQLAPFIEPVFDVAIAQNQTKHERAVEAARIGDPPADAAGPGPKKAIDDAYLRAFKGYFSSLVSSPLRWMLVAFLVAVVVVPGIAEAVCLGTLARNHATHTDLVWAWLGLGVSGLTLAIPVVFAVVYVLFGGSLLVRYVRVLLNTTKTMATDARRSVGEHDQPLASVQENEIVDRTAPVEPPDGGLPS